MRYFDDIEEDMRERCRGLMEGCQCSECQRFDNDFEDELELAGTEPSTPTSALTDAGLYRHELMARYTNPTLLQRFQAYNRWKRDVGHSSISYAASRLRGFSKEDSELRAKGRDADDRTLDLLVVILAPVMLPITATLWLGISVAMVAHEKLSKIWYGED
jgi:hypothetical protein